MTTRTRVDMDLSISTILNVTVAPEVLNILDGFGWADGDETVCVAYHDIIQHIEDVEKGNYREVSYDKERCVIFKQVIEIMKEKKLSEPDDVSFAL